VARKLITEDLRARSTHLPGNESDLAEIQHEFAAAYAGNESAFKESLLTARDYLGRLLAVTWSDISADFLTYHGILRAILEADRQLTGGANAQIIRECFAWREIAPVPTSMLVRQHTIMNCGFSSQGPMFTDEARQPYTVPAPRSNGARLTVRS